MLQHRTASCLVLAALLAFPVPPPGGPWDKAPKNWTLADAYKVLRDSPWSPSKIAIESRYTQHKSDPHAGIDGGSPLNTQNTGLVRGVELTRTKSLPGVAVLWWSSKAIRLAKLRLAQLRSARIGNQSSFEVPEMPDIVLAIEGEEPQRIFRDAKQDLRDTVFLEVGDGFALDLTDVKFIEATDADDARTEFHFPRERDGQPVLLPDSERVVFHCRAEAKTPRQGRENDISVRVEFKPADMRLRNTPDL